MKLRNSLVSLMALFSSFCFADEVDYSQFISPQDMISFETEKIASIPDSKPGMLSDAYMNRAESLIISENATAAIDDIRNALYYASLCPKVEQDLLLCRGLFDLCIAYGATDRIEELKSTAGEFQLVLSNLQCDDCHQNNYGSIPITKSSSKNNPKGYIINCSSGDWPILGPEHVSVSKCVKYAEGLADGASDLVDLFVRKDAAFVFKQLIRGLREQAIGCCYAGGVWKACLQPLANKFHSWNQKWKVLGIPADPAWD